MLWCAHCPVPQALFAGGDGKDFQGLAREVINRTCLITEFLVMYFKTCIEFVASSSSNVWP